MTATGDEALRFGPEGQLVGILSHPERAPAATAMVILNAGVLHRVGPHRLHVLLARRMATRGLATFRLDLGGIGDSTTTAPDAATFRETAVADTRVAMAGVTGAVGADKFIVFGICAGADNAIATALVDDRVAGIVLVDPHTYASRRSQLRELRTQLARQASPSAAARWLFGVARRRVLQRVERMRNPPPPAEGREPPPIATHREQLNAIANRGVKILAVFSGIHGPRYNDVDQVFELFPELRGRIEHLYFPTANHTFTELAMQAELIDAVTAWVAKRFG